MVNTAKYVHELDAINRLCTRMRLTSKIVRGGSPYDGFFDTDVIIIQSQSGIAIDLSESSIAIFFSMDYSFIINAQMRTRILSYSKEVVQYYYLLGRDTIDEDIYRAWRTNRKLLEVPLDRKRKVDQ